MKKFYDEVAALIKANPALKDVELCATLLAVVAQTVESVSSPDLRREMEEAIKKIFTQMLRDAMYRAALADVHCDAGQRAPLRGQRIATMSRSARILQRAAGHCVHVLALAATSLRRRGPPAQSQ